MHTRRLGWSGAQWAHATAAPDGSLPCVAFVAEARQCPRCGGPMAVHKTRQRLVMSIQAGVFEAKEVLKRCARHRSHPSVGSRSLSRVVKARQRYSYDLIVHVGVARYLRNMQREEICTELYDAQGIVLSPASVSSLCDRFLRYLEALHLNRAPALRQAMEEGYPLHFDATCEHGKGGLLVCMNGWRGWVLAAARIPSEHEAHIRPLLEHTTALFGYPVAVVRDLSDAGAKAVTALRARGIPDLVCHYHFLAAVAKKLFDNPYATLRNLLRRQRLRADLTALLRELRHYRRDAAHRGRFGSGPVREDLLALVLWVLEGEGKKDLVYPFSLPLLELYQRCQQASLKVQCWLPGPRTQPERRAIAHLGAIVNRCDRDERFLGAVAKLEIGWQAFCELRDVLRISNDELPRAEGRYHQIEFPAFEAQRLTDIEKAVEQYRAELRERVESTGAGNAVNPSPSAVVLKYFARYDAHLFGHPTCRDENGVIVKVVERTNNVAECFFGRKKQQLRRRVGRAQLGRDLEDQPAQAALAENLHHADYVRVLCGSLEHLHEAFAALDHNGCDSDIPLSRGNRNSPLHRRIKALLAAPQQPQTCHSREPQPYATGASPTVV